MSDSFFVVPGLILPSQGEEIVQASLDAIWVRAVATNQFLNGEISPSDFEEVLWETGLEPYVVADCWENGVSLNGDSRH